MFKAALVLLTAFYFVSPAQATLPLPQVWVADGVREVAFSNDAVVKLLPFQADNFDSMARCESFIDAQNSLLMDKNLKGVATTQKVIAVCSQQR